MDNAIAISDVEVSSDGIWNELRAHVDGEQVYFRIPACHDIYPVAEPFIAISLLEAMFTSRPIVVKNAAISKALYERLGEIQELYSCWNSDLKIIDIYADTSSDVKQYKNVGSFFSAGVDSTHTLLRNMDEITHLIVFKNFDYGNDPESWKNRIQKQTEFASSINKVLVPVETNARDWTDTREITWHFAHGLFLSSVGGAFGLKKSYVPSSHTYDELFPWGSHPLSDPMWSTESTKVIHDGAGYRRGQKMKQILKNRILSDNLQTCWVYTHKNCGTCPKCARSILAVHLLGGATASLPAYHGDDVLKLLKARDESGATFLEDAMLLAKETHQPHIYKKLKYYYRQYQLMHILFLFDRYLLNNTMRDIYRKIKRPKWLDLRVSMRGRTRWEI